MSTFRAFFRLLIPVKATGFYYPFWMIGTMYDVSMGILEPVFTAWILTSIIAKDIHGLYFAIAIFAGAKILQQIVGFCMEFVKSRCINRIEISVEDTFFRRFIQFESTKAELYGTGKIMSLSNKGVWQWVAILMDVIPDMISQILMIVVGFVIISANVPLSYLIFITALFTGNVALTIFAQKKASASRIQGSRMNSEIDRKRTQIIMSKFEILQNNKIDRELSLLSSMINKMGDFWIQSIRITASADSLAIFGTNILHIGIYLVIGIGVIRGEYQLATLVLLSGIVFNLLSYVWGVQRTLGKFFDAFVHVGQLWETLDSTPIYHKSKDQSEFYFKNGSIALKNITFSYTPESPVFKNFSLTLEWGKKYALVGPSGGGKTTLVKILSGYIVPDSGEIRIDGQSLSDTLLVSYYRHIGYLTQDPSVFDGTIVDNLIYALHDDDLKDLSARIRKVLLLAKCDFVYDFPKGIETEIGERGIRLSGGQKQRLAIAKIMLKNPKIIFLDEPTSALDSFNEEEVTIALGNLFAGRTVVVVAHRLQTVQSADTIFYIENGKVLESWNHQSLIASGGPYKKMLDLQSGF